MNINKDFLTDNGFVLVNINNTDAYKKTYTANDKTWYIEMYYGIADTPGRNWWMSINNARYVNVLSGDVQTISHMNKMFSIADIDLRIGK